MITVTAPGVNEEIILPSIKGGREQAIKQLEEKIANVVQTAVAYASQNSSSQKEEPMIKFADKSGHMECKLQNSDGTWGLQDKTIQLMARAYLPEKIKKTIPEECRPPAIPFDQGKLIKKLGEVKSKYPELVNINRKFRGLCDIICNIVLVKDLLGSNEDKKFLKRKITLETLNSLTDSHITDVYSYFSKFFAFTFNVYPHNLFSRVEQKQLIIFSKEEKKSSGSLSLVSNSGQQLVLSEAKKELNRPLIAEGLKRVEKGETLKVETFSKDSWRLSGHSLLVKKVNDDNYTFFDPNQGEYRDLSGEALLDKIRDANAFSNLLFMRASGFLKDLDAHSTRFERDMP